MKYYFTYCDTPVGTISIAEENGYITDIRFAEGIADAEKCCTGAIV